MSRYFKHLVCLMTVILALAATRTSWAGKKICLKWKYVYDDYAIGEDRLLKESGLSYGLVVAAYARVNVWRDGVQIVGFETFTDANGCTPDLGSAAGTYEVQIYPKFWRNSRKVSVYPSRGSNWRSFRSIKTRPAGAETITAIVPSAMDTVANVAAVVTVVLQQAWDWLDLERYYIYAEDGGPDNCVACHWPPDDAVYLNGYDVGEPGGLWQWAANLKFVVAHEFGHYVDARMRGVYDYSYAYKSDTLACKCDHVTMPDSDSHCMQSTERSSAAQGEGFAHMFSTMVNNYTGSSTMWFGYYKEFMKDGQDKDHPSLPPVPLETWRSNARWRWMDAHSCDGPKASGIELDWAEFWFSTSFKTSPSFTASDITAIYSRVCGGLPCTVSDHSSWDKLEAAVVAQWEQNSDEDIVWQEQGAYYGVDDHGAADGDP